MIRKQEPLIPLRRIRGQYWYTSLMRINSNANKGAYKLCQMKWMTHKCTKGTVFRNNITFRFTFLFCQSTITTQFKSISGSILHHPNNTVRLIFDTWCFRCRSTASLCIASKSIFSTPPTLILSSIVCSAVYLWVARLQIQPQAHSGSSGEFQSGGSLSLLCMKQLRPTGGFVHKWNLNWNAMDLSTNGN